MTSEIALVLAVLGITIVLFVTDVMRVDVVAILVMLSLVWLGLIDARDAFSGFSSNAAIAIIGVMILGYGVDRSGVMASAIRPVLRVAGADERRLVAFVSIAAGGMSAFMQNIGSAALFLPALLRISRTARIPVRRLLMPVAFATIIGGTLSMVGSGPLIILNDLLRQGGQERFGLFSVTPVGLALLAACIVYFVLFGSLLLPGRADEGKQIDAQRALIEAWQLPSQVFEYSVPDGSSLIGQTHEEAGLCPTYDVHLLALQERGDVSYAPWRYTRFSAGQVLALTGSEENARRFAAEHGLRRELNRPCFEELRSGELLGFAALVVLPRAPLAGKTIREITMRKIYGVEPFLILTGDEELRGDVSDHALRPGDEIIVYGPWENIAAMGDRRNFVPVTPVATAQQRPARPIVAVLCFAGAIALAVAGFPLSLSMMTGALAMVLSRVISIDEAYHAIEWRIVFLLAGLIPLGLAMDQTGAAQYIAMQLIALLGHSHPIVTLTTIAALATLFSLFMSNVAATVMLAPLAMSVGAMTGLEPRSLALLVAVCAANSFILPTHQVNALFMVPGGYRNTDYLKAGGGMTVIFIVIAVAMVYVFYL